MNYLGIDPGAAGGIATISPIERDHNSAVALLSMPRTETDVWNALYSLKAESDEWVAVIEKVGGYVGGSGGNLGSAMFKFGRGVGVLVGCLIACDFSFEEVNPATWQRALGVPARKRTTTKTQHKNAIKNRAQALFPSEGRRITLATADALMLAEYARRKYEGRL